MADHLERLRLELRAAQRNVARQRRAVERRTRALQEFVRRFGPVPSPRRAGLDAVKREAEMELDRWLRRRDDLQRAVEQEGRAGIAFEPLLGRDEIAEHMQQPSSERNKHRSGPARERDLEGELGIER